MPAPPVRSVLVVIDVQRAVVESAADVVGVITRINELLERARSTQAPVVFIQHEDPHDPTMRRGSDGWQLVDALEVGEDPVVVAKRFRDSFAGTSLGEHLASLDATHLVLTGAQSDYCVLATTFSALHHGFDVTLVRDAHTTCATGGGPEDLSGEQIISFVNANVTWLTHPGGEVRVRRAKEVEL